MNVVYASCTCSKSKFSELFKGSGQIPGQQVQKYHRLLMEGIVMSGVKVRAVTALPITGRNTKRKHIAGSSDEENGISFTYLPILNIHIVKHMLIFLTSFFRTLRFLREEKESGVICDVLNITVSAGALLAARLLKRKSVGIVTDIPVFLFNNSNSFTTRINNFIIDRFSSYVFLTEQMNDLINKKKAPHVIIEGQVDINMRNVDNRAEDKYPKKVCIYAGGLQKIYGIKYLVEAFIKADVPDSELHVYGSGDFEEELAEICKSNGNIKYFGVVPNDEVVKAEMRATLLVNPRPSTEEFTKYSFPSKNMEYMVSGTPVLTTKLPGMPEEYYNFVYLINKENVEQLSQRITEILGKDKAELHEKGLEAKAFVLKEKNNVTQSRKIISLLGEVKK